jgi:transposase
MKERRRYSDELKAEAVKMVNEQGLTQEETGRRLSLPKGTISNWVKASKSERDPAKPEDQSVTQLAAEVQRLRRELAEARMEREILKKAAAYFAKESLPGTRS